MAVLARIYFATAGLRMDLATLGHPAVLGAAEAVLLVAILGTFIGAYGGARASRLSRWEGLALGAGLNARGVIQVIVTTAPPLLRYATRRIAVVDEERLRERDLRGQADAPADRDRDARVPGVPPALDQ
jgi:hypothetical protein